MKVSDYIIKTIAETGTSHIFGFIGGAVTHLVDSAAGSSGVSFIQTYHEQTAALAAEGYSRSSSGASGHIGVAMATSGPGATNLITGIADAWFDSIPVLFITGQVNTFEYKAGKPVRQQGFQETDILGLVRTITKYSELVSDPSRIRYAMEKALSIAREGRPGPVLLDIPMDVQRADIDPDKIPSYNMGRSHDTGRIPGMARVFGLLERSHRPMILAGGGVVKAGGMDALRVFARRAGIPVAVSLMGKGSFPEDDSLFMGMLGSYGNRSANMAVANCDLLLAVGSRLDTRQTGTDLGSFVRSGTVVHVDIDPYELKHNRLKGRVKVQADARSFLEALSSGSNIHATREWTGYLETLKKEMRQTDDVRNAGINDLPYRVMEALGGTAGEDDVFTVDIGQNQMFAAQSLPITGRRSFHTSGGLAPMGCAIPFAIGAAFSDDAGRRITAITGDGGLHISVQALQLISQYRLPIRVVVINNHSLGMITQFQDLYFGGRRNATVPESGYVVPDLSAIAAAYGLGYQKVTAEDFRPGVFDVFKPGIVEISIPSPTTVVPKLEVNRPVEETSPDLPSDSFIRHMLIPPAGRRVRR